MFRRLIHPCSHLLSLRSAGEFSTRRIKSALAEAFKTFILKYAQQRGLDKADKENEPEKVKEQERPEEPHRPASPEKAKNRTPVSDNIRADQQQRLNEKAHLQEVRFRQKMMEQNRAYHEKRDAIVEEERRKSDNI